ncbi:MAG: TonB-dependent receptor plug domain-containing protein, partial [Candidatus Omnitrophota bacterium]
MYRIRFTSFVFVAALLITVNVFAQSNSGEIALERIVVTPIRHAQEVQKICAPVSVITKQDIENSNAHTITDILKTQPGLVVRDYYGNGVKVSVDLRGFGETAGSNTLVLVDGRRINEIDLSGVDWTQVP